MIILREGVSAITGRTYSREVIASLDGMAVRLIEEQLEPCYDALKASLVAGHATIEIIENAKGKLEAQIPVQGECRNVLMHAIIDSEIISQIESISWVLI